MKYLSFLVAAICCLSLHAFAQEKVDTEVNEIIRKHGLEQSQIMETASLMMDVYGPRLTASSKLERATDWAVDRLKEMGLQNVHTEEWGPFGRGWELEHFEMHAAEPGYFPVHAYPKAWSPSTDGEISGEVIYLDANTVEGLEAYKGKLGGKFVLLDTARMVEEWFEAPAQRFDSDRLLEMANAPAPTVGQYRNYRSNREFSNALWALLYDEQPLAILDRSYKGDLGTIFVTGARTAGGRAWEEGKDVIPQATVAVEHYNRIFRLMKKGIPVKLKMNLQASYHNPDKGMERNIIAEIPGTDLKDEVVMFGAHFDSWHSATGATDNGAGSSVMMEAARILLETIKETGVKPRRTLRLALWTGEEQGLWGSRGYVADHFAEVGEGRNVTALKPEQEKISAYYNMDNGTGRIRGVYMQGNPHVEPIFRAWLDDFRDLDATTLTMSNTGGTDHLAFDGVGIPGFQFIQDPVAYSTRTHHSNMDNWDHLIADDLKQAATIIASFVWHTSQRDEMLPRKEFKVVSEEEAATGSRR